MRSRTTKALFVNQEESISRFTISPNNTVKLAWDVFVACLALYNCMTIPLSFSFEPECFKSLVHFDKVVDSMYWVDILVAFRAQKQLDDGTLI